MKLDLPRTVDGTPEGFTFRVAEVRRTLRVVRDEAASGRARPPGHDRRRRCGAPTAPVLRTPRSDPHPDHGAGGIRNRAAAAGPNRSSSSQAADDGTHAAWRQLCRYLQRCLEAEAAESLVPYVQENSLWFLHPGEEKLVVGTSDSMAGTRQTLRKTDIAHTADDLRLADRGCDRTAITCPR